MVNGTVNGTKGLAILGRNGIIGVFLGLLILVGGVFYLYNSTVNDKFHEIAEAYQTQTAALIKVEEGQEDLSKDFDRLINGMDTLEDSIREQTQEYRLQRTSRINRE